MHNFTWNGIRLRIQSLNVQVGTSQLELRRCFRNAEGTPILLLSGFHDSSQVFLPRSSSGQQNQGGLAPFLASQGYDVYLADLRGKGNSWPQASRQADWGLHEAICEDIPAHLAMIDRLRPGAPQFWIGQDLGSLLLLATYARAQFAKEQFTSEDSSASNLSVSDNATVEQQLLSPVLGMAHFSVGRRRTKDNWMAKQKYYCWNSYCALSRFMAGYISLPFGEVVSRETPGSFAGWRQWQSSDSWLDPVDLFDYRKALARVSLPPSLYIANNEQELWGSPTDCRALMSELGPHDARMITVDKKGGNERNYTVNGLLRHPASCHDHFLQLKCWLEEHDPASLGAKKETNIRESGSHLATIEMV